MSTPESRSLSATVVGSEQQTAPLFDCIPPKSRKGVKNCESCGKKFGMLDNKGNCTKCGIVCHVDCINLKVALPPTYTGPVAVCGVCYTDVENAKIVWNDLQEQASKKRQEVLRQQQPIQEHNPSYHDRLRRYFEFYDSPEHIEKIGEILEKYKGREEEYIARLVKRYGPEPDTAGQQPIPQTSVQTPRVADGKNNSISNSSANVTPRTQASPRNPDSNMNFNVAGSDARKEPVTDPAPVDSPNMQEDTNGTRDYRQRIEAILQAYDPKRKNKVDQYLQKFKGNEQSFIDALVNKYGPEPGVTALVPPEQPVSIPTQQPSSLISPFTAPVVVNENKSHELSPTVPTLSAGENVPAIPSSAAVANNDLDEIRKRLQELQDKSEMLRDENGKLQRNLEQVRSEADMKLATKRLLFEKELEELRAQLIDAQSRLQLDAAKVRESDDNEEKKYRHQIEKIQDTHRAEIAEMENQYLEKEGYVKADQLVLRGQNQALEAKIKTLLAEKAAFAEQRALDQQVLDKKMENWNAEKDLLEQQVAHLQEKMLGMSQPVTVNGEGNLKRGHNSTTEPENMTEVSVSSEDDGDEEKEKMMNSVEGHRRRSLPMMSEERNDTLMQEVDDLKSEVERLTNIQVEAARVAEDASATVVQLRAEIVVLKAQRESAAKEHADELEASDADHAQNVSLLKQKHAKEQESLSESIRQLNSEVERLTALHDETAQSADEASAVVAVLRAEIETLKAAKEQLTKEHAEQLEASDADHAQVVSLQQKLATEQESMRELQSEVERLTNLQRENGDVSATVVQLRAEIEALKSEQESAAKEHADELEASDADHAQNLSLLKQKHAKEQESLSESIRQLNSEVERLTALHDETAQSADEASAVVAVLRAEIETLKAAKEQLTKEHAEQLEASDADHAQIVSAVKQQQAAFLQRREEELNERIIELEAKMKQQYEKYQNDLQHSQTEHEKALNAIEHKHLNEVNLLKAERDQSVSETLEARETNHKAEITEIKREAEENLAYRLKEAETEFKSLEKEKENMKAQIEALEQRQAAFSEEHDQTLQDAEARHRTEMEKVRDEVTLLRDQYQSLDDELQRYKNPNEAEEKTLLENRLSEQAETNADLRTKLESAEAAVLDLQALLEEARKELKRAQDEQCSLLIQHNEHENKAKEFQDTIAQLTQQLSEIPAKQDAHESSLKELRDKNEETRSLNEKLSAAEQENGTKLAKLEESNDALNATTASLQETINQLNQQLAAIRTEYEEKRVAAAAIQQAHAKQEAEIEMLTEHLAEADKKREIAEEETKQLVEKLSAHETQQLELHSENSKLKTFVQEEQQRQIEFALSQIAFQAEKVDVEKSQLFSQECTQILQDDVENKRVAVDLLESTVSKQKSCLEDEKKDLIEQQQKVTEALMQMTEGKEALEKEREQLKVLIDETNDKVAAIEQKRMSTETQQQELDKLRAQLELQEQHVKEMIEQEKRLKAEREEEQTRLVREREFIESERLRSAQANEITQNNLLQMTKHAEEAERVAFEKQRQQLEEGKDSAALQERISVLETEMGQLRTNLGMAQDALKAKDDELATAKDSQQAAEKEKAEMQQRLSEASMSLVALSERKSIETEAAMSDVAAKYAHLDELKQILADRTEELKRLQHTLHEEGKNMDERERLLVQREKAVIGREAAAANMVRSSTAFAIPFAAALTTPQKLQFQLNQNSNDSDAEAPGTYLTRGRRLAPSNSTVISSIILPCDESSEPSTRISSPQMDSPERAKTPSRTSAANYVLPLPPAPTGFTLGDWEANIAAAAEVSNKKQQSANSTDDSAFWHHCPLRSVAFAAARRWQLLDTSVAGTQWNRFLHAVEANYKQSNPYHNNLHAADVVHSVMCLMERCKPLLSSLKPAEKLALLIAASIHDVGHPGLTNGFLNNSSDPIAMVHNFSSPLENTHTLIGMLLLQHPKLDCTSLLTKNEAQSVLKLLPQLIKYTDNSYHDDLLLRVNLRVLKPLQPQLARACANASATSGKDKETMIETKINDAADVEAFFSTNEPARIIAMALILHAADLGALAKPKHIRSEWGWRLITEFDAQARVENEKGLPMAAEIIPVVGPGVREKDPDGSEGAAAFIEHVVLPLYETLRGIFPDAVHGDLELPLTHLTAALSKPYCGPQSGSILTLPVDYAAATAEIKKLREELSKKKVDQALLTSIKVERQALQDEKGFIASQRKELAEKEAEYDNRTSDVRAIKDQYEGQIAVLQNRVNTLLDGHFTPLTPRGATPRSTVRTPRAGRTIPLTPAASDLGVVNTPRSGMVGSAVAGLGSTSPLDLNMNFGLNQSNRGNSAANDFSLPSSLGGGDMATVFDVLNLRDAALRDGEASLRQREADMQQREELVKRAARSLRDREAKLRQVFRPEEYLEREERLHKMEKDAAAAAQLSAQLRLENIQMEELQQRMGLQTSAIAAGLKVANALAANLTRLADDSSSSQAKKKASKKASESHHDVNKKKKESKELDRLEKNVNSLTTRLHALAESNASTPDRVKNYRSSKSTSMTPLHQNRDALINEAAATPQIPRSRHAADMVTGLPKSTNRTRQSHR